MNRAHSWRLIAYACVHVIAMKPLFAQVPLPEAVLLSGTSLPLNQIVTVSVSEINAISISGDVTMTISGATAGQDPDPVIDANSTFNVTVNGASKKITAVLAAPYSTGISLELLLAAPSGGTATSRILSAISQDLVTGFEYVAETSLAVTYTASATPQAAPNGLGEIRTVTITLTDN